MLVSIARCPDGYPNVMVSDCHEAADGGQRRDRVRGGWLQRNGAQRRIITAEVTQIVGSIPVTMVCGIYITSELHIVKRIANLHCWQNHGEEVVIWSTIPNTNFCVLRMCLCRTDCVKRSEEFFVVKSSRYVGRVTHYFSFLSDSIAPWRGCQDPAG